MSNQLLNSLKIDLSIKSRQKAIQKILAYNITADILIHYIINTNDRNKVLFVCVLDNIIDQDINYLNNNLDAFITLAIKTTIETCKRCISRIFANLLKANSDLFTIHQKQQIINLHFDWLISNSLVATRVNCITVLFYLRNHADWITSDLVAIIDQQIQLQEPSFVSRAKKILHKIHKQAKQ